MNRHEVNCLTKEEFERWSKSPGLVRQASQLGSSSMQLPLVSSSSVNDVIKSPTASGTTVNESSGLEAGANSMTKDEASAAARQERALALMVQPSVDYG